MSDIASDSDMDCIGMFCPIPLAKTKEVIANINIGSVLKVQADDPDAEQDIPGWAKRAGLPASSSTLGFSAGLNSTQSGPTPLLPNPSSTLQGTWYRQLTCIPDQASLKVNG